MGWRGRPNHINNPQALTFFQKTRLVQDGHRVEQQQARLEQGPQRKAHSARPRSVEPLGIMRFPVRC